MQGILSGRWDVGWPSDAVFFVRSQQCNQQMIERIKWISQGRGRLPDFAQLAMEWQRSRSRSLAGFLIFTAGLDLTISSTTHQLKNARAYIEQLASGFVRARSRSGSRRASLFPDGGHLRF